MTGRQFFHFTACRHPTSLTRGTISAASTLPATTWFVPICFITQAKTGMSALGLRCFLGISVYVALKMKHKLQHAMQQADDRQRQEGDTKTYHSVSSKHLPHYLTEISFRFNNRFISGAMITNLAERSINTKPRPQRLFRRLPRNRGNKITL